MADHVAKKLPLRHPAEIPTFILMVILNFAILAVLIDFLASAALIPPALRGTNWEAAWRAVAGVIILVAPTIMIVRQVQRTRSRRRADGPTTTSCCPTSCSRTSATTTGTERGSSSATRSGTSGSITWRCGTSWCCATRS